MVDQLQFSQEGSSDSYHDVNDELVEVSVHFVDVFNYTFNADGKGNRSFVGVRFAEIQANNSGECRVPCCGDQVLIRRYRGGDAVYVKHLMPVPEFFTEDQTGRAKEDFLAAPRDHQYLRVPPMPGDRSWFAVGGAFLQLLRGGIVRIGASPLCQFTMGKFENFWRLISQNWEFFSTGLNAYSVNHKGKITTAVSFFIRDTHGLTFSRNPVPWSARSDYHMVVDANGLGFLAGEVKEKEWIRKNRLKIEILPDGTIKIYQGKLSETTQAKQEILLGPEGKFFQHKQWDENNVLTYSEHIQTTGDHCQRIIKMKGTSRIEVDGSYVIEASGKVSVNGQKVEIGKKSGELAKSPAVVVVDGATFTSQTPIHSFKGMEE